MSDLGEAMDHMYRLLRQLRDMRVEYTAPVWLDERRAAQAWLSRVEQSAAPPIQPVIETVGAGGPTIGDMVRVKDTADHVAAGMTGKLVAWPDKPDGVFCTEDATHYLVDHKDLERHTTPASEIARLTAKLSTVEAATIERCAKLIEDHASDVQEILDDPRYAETRNRDHLVRNKRAYRTASEMIRSLAKTQGERT